MSNRLVEYLKSSKVELKKVSWPTKKETMKFTLIVIGMSAFVAVFLGALDLIFSKGLTFLLK
jgi:preprotein translocase subunit SecE